MHRSSRTLQNAFLSFLLIPLLLALHGCGGDDDGQEPESIYGFIASDDADRLLLAEEINDLSSFRCDDDDPYIFVPSHADPEEDPPRLWALTFRAQPGVDQSLSGEDDIKSLDMQLHEALDIEKEEEEGEDNGEQECSIEKESAASWTAIDGFITFESHDRAYFELEFTEENDGNGAAIPVYGCWVVSRDGTDCDSTGIPASASGGDHGNDD